MAASGPTAGVPLRCTMAALAGVHLTTVHIASATDVGETIYLHPSDVVNTFSNCEAANNRDYHQNYDRRYLAATRGRYDWQRPGSMAHESRRLAASGGGIEVNVTFSVAVDVTVKDEAGKSDGSGLAVISAQSAACAVISNKLSASFATSDGAIADLSGNFSYFLRTALAETNVTSSFSFAFAAPVTILPRARFQVPSEAPTDSIWKSGIIVGVVLGIIVTFSLIITATLRNCGLRISCMGRRSPTPTPNKDEVIVEIIVAPSPTGIELTTIYDNSGQVSPAAQAIAPQSLYLRSLNELTATTQGSSTNNRQPLSASATPSPQTSGAPSPIHSP